jgi:hypothetical protein
MTLTETLKIKERYLKFEDMRAFDYVEKRWQQDGCPTERWQLVNFLEKMLLELKDKGGYPKVLLLRKKEIQRQQFTIQQPGTAPPEGCSCIGGWVLSGSLSGTPCPCPKGNPHRERLAKWGMRV